MPVINGARIILEKVIAHTDFLIVAVQNIGTMTIAAHPASQNGFWRLITGSNIFGGRPELVTSGINALPELGTVGANVGKEIIQRHIVAVALSRVTQLWAYAERRAACLCPFLVCYVNDLLGKIRQNAWLKDKGYINESVG